MDHLGDNFFSARFGLHQVPLFANVQADGLHTSFHTLHKSPGPLGWIIEDDGRFLPTKWDSLQATEVVGQSSQSLTKFVQRWLWFEVLRGILGHLPGFNFYDFIKEDSDGNQLVTTLKLSSYLQRWWDYETQHSDRQRQVQAHLILERARFHVSQYCAVKGDQKHPIWPINQNVALSIMVLGETLTTALIRIQQALKSEVHGWHGCILSPQGWGYSSAVLQILERENVCPTKISMLKGRFQNNTIGLLFALHRLPRGSPGEYHGMCDDKHCEAVQIYLPRVTGNQSNTSLAHGKPKSIHCPSCSRKNCQQIGPDTEELSDIIQGGKIPLLQYDKSTATVNLIGVSEPIGMEYVAFSHVWTDGYGNPNANVLNQCVLDMFIHLFGELRDLLDNKTSAIAPEQFWIDTLAIPVQAKYRVQRKKAIESMHRIYKGAKCTIVLDSGLMSVSREEGYAHSAMSIRASQWMTRLWTLQEAVLSRELYFNFSDDLVSMDRLVALSQKENASLHSPVPFVSRMYHGIMEESRTIRGLGSNSDDGDLTPDFVAAAWRALQWRTTAHLQHETLAIASLLNVNTECFANSDHRIDQRMQKLLDILAACKPCPIPPGIMFLSGPRLSEKGYRWAPQTWLSNCPVEPPDPMSLKCPKARLNPSNGLEVKFPGFLLNRPSETSGLFIQTNTFHFPTDRALGKWYRIVCADDEAENRDVRKLAIIVPQLPVINPREIALLVAVDRKIDNIFYVEIQRRIWISEVSDPEKIKKLKQNFLTANRDSPSWGEIISDEDYWCVDGPDPPQPIDEPDDDDDDDDGDRNSTTPSNFRSWIIKSSKIWR